MMRQRPARIETVREYERDVVKSLDEIENVWLKNQPFIAGHEISVADIFAACEIEQTRKYICSYSQIIVHNSIIVEFKYYQKTFFFFTQSLKLNVCF